MKTSRAPWDGGYHAWLEHHAVLRDLLERYAPAGFLDEVDLGGLEFYKTDTYLLPDFEKRDGDMVLKLPRQHHDQPAWLWLLLEVQLSQRGDMAFRALGYVYGLYLHLRRQHTHEGPFELPPVFVLVLYHGQEPWREPEDLWGLIDLPEGSPLWRFQPQLHFWLLREQQPSPHDLPLAQETNLAALLLRLNRCHHLEDLLPVLGRLFVILEEPRHEGLRPVLAAWVLQVLNKKRKFNLTKDDLAPLWQETPMGLEDYADQIIEEMILKVTGKTVDQLKEEFRVEFEQNLTPQLRAELTPKIREELAPQLREELTPQLRQEVEAEIERETRRALLLETLQGRFGEDPQWSAICPEDLDLAAIQRLWRAALLAPDKAAFLAHLSL